MAIAADSIRRFSPDAALREADEALRPANSPLIRHRRACDGQIDWREEVGQWLLTSNELGFRADLNSRLQRAFSDYERHGYDGACVGFDPNEQMHRILMQELAPLMAVYFFTGHQWVLDAWDPKDSPGFDVDFRMRAPTGTIVDVQVKASDVPGRVVNHRLVDGEYDDRVLVGLEKAAERQLPRPAVHSSIVLL